MSWKDDLLQMAIVGPYGLNSEIRLWLNKFPNTFWYRVNTDSYFNMTHRENKLLVPSFKAARKKAEK